MNMKGMFVGWLTAGLLALGICIGIQLIIWGNNAPIWYAAPIIIACFIAGFVGAHIGDKYIKS